MDAVLKQDYLSMLEMQQKEVRQLVMDGLKQISEGKMVRSRRGDSP